MRTTSALVALACAVIVHGCASWRTADGPLPEGSAKAVPPAAVIAAPKPGPVGDDTIGRYGADVTLQPSGGTVTPVISLMPVAPAQYGPPGMARPSYGYAPYPPPPPYAQPTHEPYSDAVGRGIAGGVIGGIIGAQVGSGSGSHVSAGVGAAAGTMLGLGASDNPCASPSGGTLAGAAVGGMLGYQVGSGSGRSAATALGTMIGALAGTHAGASPACR